MEFKNLAKFYIDEHGRVDKTEDTSFIVSGSENETALELLIANTSTTPTDIVVYASFKRADGFVISNRSLEFKGVTEDSKYYDFIYTFGNDRILDIAGQLEVSFTIKSGTKTINSVSNTLYVRRNVKPNLETTTEEEFYQQAIEIVEHAQQDINQHRIESEAKFNTKVDKETYEHDMPTKLDKVSTANQIYSTDDSGNQTSLPYSKNAKGGTIVQRNDDGQIDTQTPTEEQHATNKGYVDNAINQAVNPINKGLDNKVDKTQEANKLYGTDNEGNANYIEYSTGSTEGGNSVVVRDDNNRININDPLTDTHGVNKRYGDSTYLGVNKVNASAQPNTVPIRDSNGRIIVATPTEDNHAATKKYVQEQIQEYMNSSEEELILPYDTLEQALNSVVTKVENGKKIFVSITNEDGTITYSSNKTPLGTQILIREEGVEDYWLSKKEINEDEPVFNFFTPFEANANLDNYYNKEDIDEKFSNISVEATKQLTGEEIENGTFKDGEQIYCTLSSDFFTANTYYIYVASNNSFKPISTSSPVTITPSISALNVTTNPTSVATIEVGNSFDVTKFTASLKKYADFEKVVFGITDVGGTNNVEETITEITSNSVSLTTNHTLKKSKFGSFTAWVRGYNSNNTQIGYTSYTLSTSVARQYYGIAPDNPNLEVMTSELATSYYKSITSNTNEIQTVLKSSRTTSVTLNLSDTPTYVWFIIPSNLSISKMTSGGFDFPFIQQSNVTINNQYNTDIEYKVYRSANKIYGTTTINLS